MSLNPRHLSRSGLFVLLMAMALVAALLPPRSLAWLRAGLQPLSWLQSPVTGMTHWVLAWGGTADELSPADAERLRAENDQLRRQLAHFDQRYQELRYELEQVTRVRQQLQDTDSRIISAQVIGPLSDPRRDALRLARGEWAGVRVNQWVVAAEPTAERDLSGRELVARQWLIGRITEVRPYESVVTLLSDRTARPERVVVAGVRPDGTWERLSGEMLLHGGGDGRLQIREATQSFLDGGGGRVVLVPASEWLPSAMTVGRLEDAQRVEQTQLHYNLTVAPWGEARQLRYVYIIDMAATR
jgi:cell shape-determining protein MreC